MAILNFPNTRDDGSPLQSGDQYTGDNGVTYIFDGVKWLGHALAQPAGTNSITNNGHTVQVDSSGNLVIPDGRTIIYASGAPVVSGGSGFQLTSSTAVVSLSSTGTLTLPTGYSIGGNTNGNDGIALTTDRGTILFGNHPECLGGENHFHIMKEDASAVDLFLGDDNNYVKLPGSGETAYGVEIGTNTGTAYTWRFGTDGTLTLPGNIQSPNSIGINVPNFPTLASKTTAIMSNGTVTTVSNFTTPSQSVIVIASGAETSTTTNTVSSIVSIVGLGLMWTRRAQYLDPASSNNQQAEVWYAINSSGNPITDNIVITFDNPVDDQGTVVSSYVGCNLDTPWTASGPFYSNSTDPSTNSATITMSIAEPHSAGIVFFGVPWYWENADGSFGTGFAVNWSNVAEADNGGAVLWEYDELSYRQFTLPQTDLVVTSKYSGTGTQYSQSVGLTVIADALVGNGGTSNWTINNGLAFPDGTLQTTAWNGSIPTRWDAVPVEAGCPIYTELTSDHFFAYTQNSHLALENAGDWNLGSNSNGTYIFAVGNTTTIYSNIGDVVISLNNSQSNFIFGLDGNLTIPAGGVISDSTDYLTTRNINIQGALKGVDGSIGTTGQVLTRQSNGGVAWADSTGGGGAPDGGLADNTAGLTITTYFLATDLNNYDNSGSVTFNIRDAGATTAGIIIKGLTVNHTQTITSDTYAQGDNTVAWGNGSIDYQLWEQMVSITAYAVDSRGYTFYAVVTDMWDVPHGPCLVEGTQVTMADGTHKAIEDIQHGELVRVWNFDLGEFSEAQPLWVKAAEETTGYDVYTFSDGTKLRTVGHHMFNKEAGAFTKLKYAETPVGTTTFNERGEEVTLLSKERVTAPTRYYNVWTQYHLNLFADGILTSNRFNNIYPIVDMKFVKDNRVLRDLEEFTGIDEKYIKGLRLQEQSQEYTAEYISNYVHNRLERLDIANTAEQGI